MYTNLVTLLAASATIVSALPSTPKASTTIKLPKAMAEARQVVAKQVSHDHASNHRRGPIAHNTVKLPKAMAEARQEVAKQATSDRKASSGKRSPIANTSVKLPKAMAEARQEVAKQATSDRKASNGKRSPIANKSIKLPKAMAEARQEVAKQATSDRKASSGKRSPIANKSIKLPKGMAEARQQVAKKASNEKRSLSASMTPHEQYSSSIGVIGTKIDTNRVAYWPGSVNCEDICVKITNPTNGQSLHVLKIDSSAGAYDVSYDAWNQLGFGVSATEQPHSGGGINMDYEFVDNEECADLLDDGKLPLSAANSMGYVASCLAQPDSWVAQNHVLYNIADSQGKYGVDEVCTLDLSVSNQPDCPSQLGVQTPMAIASIVKNVQYQTGKVVTA